MNYGSLRRVPYRYIETFINNANREIYRNKSYTYVLKYNNVVKMGYSNDIFKKFQNHYNLKGSAEILRLKSFCTTSSDGKDFLERLAKYNGNNTTHNAKREETILRTFDGLNDGKYKILDMDK
jgi:hypothetical protein